MGIRPSVIQRRHAELGRIRLGHKGDRGQPVKLSAFRFTSTQERYIRDLATLYGGEARQWTNNKVDEWEVFTDAKSIPVIVLKGGLSQWLETWSGGGCVHRCDGEVMQLPDPGRPCSEDRTTVTLRDRGVETVHRAHDVAKPTTRVSVMLPELEAIGSWRLESHGWNAAAEIPAIAELAAFVGDLVPAYLNLVERRALKDGKTSRFVVPVLDLQIGTARLREIVNASAGIDQLESSSSRPALQAPGAPQASGGTPPPSSPAVAPQDDPHRFDPWFAEVAAAPDRVALSDIWRRGVETHVVGVNAVPHPRLAEFIAAWQARAREVPEVAAPADDDGIVDAQVFEAETRSADQVWADDVMPAGNAVGMTLADLEDGFNSWSQGTLSADATADQLAAYARFLNES